MQLRTSVTKLMKNISTMLSAVSVPAFTELSAELAELQSRLDKPLRVAVVGVMKAGKSTLMNAILKEKILFTGTLETTYTVSWFKYGETPKLKVVFNDGTVNEAPYSDLEKWTVRPENLEHCVLDNVAHVEIYYPNEILKKMELIDTPGLESTTTKASGNTSSFLGQRLSEEADKITAENASKAEAIIYAFSRSVDGNDADVLDAFRGDDVKSSPINAIGLFTKADLYWRHGGVTMDISPLDIVSGSCGRFKDELKSKLFTIFPVVAKSVENVSDIDAHTFDILARLAAVDETVLQRYLANASGFKTRPADDNMPISQEDRAHVLELFGQYGIYTMASAIRDGVAQDALPDYMYEHSGVKDASDMILRHFGNRAYLIKLEYILNRLYTSTSKIKHTHYSDGQITRVCERIAEDIDRLRENEQAFRELELLQDYYNGSFKIPTSALEKEFLQITGEYGSGCEKRLGFSDAATIQSMKREAADRSRRWNGLAHNFAVSRQMNQAAEVIVRSCDNMYYHLDMLSGFED